MRAKFKCTGVSENKNYDAEVPVKVGENISLAAVTDGSEENLSFSQYTPTANMSMYITNPDVFGFFTEGNEYYLDMTPVS